MKNAFEESGKPSSEAELRVCKSVVLCQYYFISQWFTIKSAIFLTGDPPHITQHPENQSATTGANSGKPSFEAELTVCKFGVKYINPTPISATFL